MNSYKVNKYEQHGFNLTDSNDMCTKAGLMSLWDTVPTAQVNCYPWDENGYKPEMRAKMVYDSTALYLHLETIEHLDYMRTICTNHNEPVYEDSCMELFLMPDPEHQNQYMNFEFNSAGCLLLAIGKDRFDRKIIYGNRDILEIRTSSQITTVSGTEFCLWTVECKIPFRFLKEYFGPLELTSGSSLRANFHKCGDMTLKPHYGCWNLIGSGNPDFHISRYFGELILA